jgi:hypothetical protein
VRPAVLIFPPDHTVNSLTFPGKKISRLFQVAENSGKSQLTSLDKIANQSTVEDFLNLSKNFFHTKITFGTAARHSKQAIFAINETFFNNTTIDFYMLQQNTH